jgi:chromosome segregation ATPase
VQAVQGKLDQASSELARSARSSASELTDRLGQEAKGLRRELKELSSNTERDLEPLRDALQVLDEQMAARHEAESQGRHEQARHAERLRTAEGGLDALRQELSAANAQARLVKSAGREAADQIEAQKQFVRRAMERFDKRHDAFDQAIAVLADALKIADPLTATLSSSSLPATPIS